MRIILGDLYDWHVPITAGNWKRLSQRSIAQLAEVIGRHPKLHFQCFLAGPHANQSLQSLSTLARELPDPSLVGCWWHNFFPDSIRQVMAETEALQFVRLDFPPAVRRLRLQPAREGVFHDRSVHEKDRRAKWGDTRRAGAVRGFGVNS